MLDPVYYGTDSVLWQKREQSTMAEKERLCLKEQIGRHECKIKKWKYIQKTTSLEHYVNWARWGESGGKVCNVGSSQVMKTLSRLNVVLN